MKRDPDDEHAHGDSKQKKWNLVDERARHRIGFVKLIRHDRPLSLLDQPDEARLIPEVVELRITRDQAH